MIAETISCGVNNLLEDQGANERNKMIFGIRVIGRMDSYHSRSYSIVQNISCWVESGEQRMQGVGGEHERTLNTPGDRRQAQNLDRS